MRQDLLSPYRHGASLIHRIPPAPKIVGAVMAVIAVVLLPRFAWSAYVVAGAGVLAVAAAARLDGRYLAGRILILEPFIVAVALLSLVQPDGLRIFVNMVAKSTLCVLVMLLLAGTTRFSDVLQSLERLRVPHLLVTTVALMYRYLFLLADEMWRLRRARRCRTFSGSRWQAWKGIATVIAQLFVLTSERAQRIYAAMCARGWKG